MPFTVAEVSPGQGALMIILLVLFVGGPAAFGWFLWSSPSFARLASLSVLDQYAFSPILWPRWMPRGLQLLAGVCRSSALQLFVILGYSLDHVVPIVELGIFLVMLVCLAVLFAELLECGGSRAFGAAHAVIAIIGVVITVSGKFDRANSRTAAVVGATICALSLVAVGLMFLGYAMARRRYLGRAGLIASVPVATCVSPVVVVDVATKSSEVQDAVSRVEADLRRLQQWHKDGLISTAAYAEKRRELLDRLSLENVPHK